MARASEPGSPDAINRKTNWSMTVAMPLASSGGEVSVWRFRPGLAGLVRAILFHPDHQVMLIIIKIKGVNSIVFFQVEQTFH